jgi:hypothetical protein
VSGAHKRRGARNKQGHSTGEGTLIDFEYRELELVSPANDSFNVKDENEKRFQ